MSFDLKAPVYLKRISELYVRVSLFTLKNHNVPDQKNHPSDYDRRRIPAGSRDAVRKRVNASRGLWDLTAAFLFSLAHHFRIKDAAEVDRSAIFQCGSCGTHLHTIIIVHYLFLAGLYIDLIDGAGREMGGVPAMLEKIKEAQMAGYEQVISYEAEIVRAVHFSYHLFIYH